MARRYIKTTRRTPARKIRTTTTRRKTLQDFEVVLDKEVPRVYINREELKAEAMKWLNEIQWKMFDDELHYSSIFIKHFFNITEEDLEKEK